MNVAFDGTSSTAAPGRTIVGYAWSFSNGGTATGPTPTHGFLAPALGMTISDAGCSFDFDPPTAPEPDKGGRPADSRVKARTFIAEALGRYNDQVGTKLCDEWEGSGHSKSTFWRAVEDMEKDGELTTDGGTGTGRQKILHLQPPAA